MRIDWGRTRGTKSRFLEKMSSNDHPHLLPFRALFPMLVRPQARGSMRFGTNAVAPTDELHWHMFDSDPIPALLFLPSLGIQGLGNRTASCLGAFKLNLNLNPSLGTVFVDPIPGPISLQPRRTL